MPLTDPLPVRRRLGPAARLGAVLLGLLPAGPGAVAAQAAPAVERVAVLAVVRELFDAMRASDSARARAVFHPAARLGGFAGRPGAERVELADRLESFVKAVGAPKPEGQAWDERIWDEQVLIDGPLASVWTPYVFKVGDRLSHCGIDQVTLAREEGRWRIVFLMDTRRTEGCVDGSMPR